MFREVSRRKQALAFEDIVTILVNERRGVLSVLGDDGYPYGVPMNYWYNEENGYIYFHSGKKGHKVDSIMKDNKASFCVYDKGYKRDGEWALNIKSVIAFGRIFPVEDYEKSMEICKKLSLKYTNDIEYIENEIKSFGNATLCFELRPEHITGKIVNES